MANQRWIRAAGIAAVVAMLAAGGATADDIRIWQTATVTRDAVRLGDIAEISGIFAESAGIRTAIIHVAPRPGTEMLIRAADVRAALADFDVNMAMINFVGSSSCRVTRPRPPEPPKGVVIAERRPPPQHPEKRTSVFKQFAGSTRTNASAKPDRALRPGGNTVESALRDYIDSHAPAHEGRLDIRFSGGAVRQALAQPAEGLQLDIHPDDPKPSESWLGLKSFRIDVAKDGVAQAPVAVVAELALVRPVVVARRPINRGQKIDTASLRIEERRFDDERKLGVTEIRTATGQTAAEFVEAGAVIMAKALAPAPVVRRGESVTIWRRGGVMIRLAGKAQADGMLGSQIKVRRDGSKNNNELLDAMVTGPGTVELVDEPRVASR